MHRRILWSLLSSVIQSSGRYASVSGKLLHLGDIRFMFEGVCDECRSKHVRGEAFGFNANVQSIVTLFFTRRNSDPGLSSSCPAFAR